MDGPLSAGRFWDPCWGVRKRAITVPTHITDGRSHDETDRRTRSAEATAPTSSCFLTPPHLDDRVGDMRPRAKTSRPYSLMSWSENATCGRDQEREPVKN